jgi:hypothetical protein
MMSNWERSFGGREQLALPLIADGCTRTDVWSLPT